MSCAAHCGTPLLLYEIAASFSGFDSPHPNRQLPRIFPDFLWRVGLSSMTSFHSLLRALSLIYSFYTLDRVRFRHLLSDNLDLCAREVVQSGLNCGRANGTGAVCVSSVITVVCELKTRPLIRATLVSSFWWYANGGERSVLPVMRRHTYS
jgi:hypothetical protein